MVLEIIKREFKRYYSGLNIEDLRIPEMTRREFAFLHFGGEIMVRHLCFPDPSSLREHIIENVPAHVYHSSAYYENPDSQEMNEKGWQGADLIFDIDSDHIKTPCKEKHDRWICLECGQEGAGFPPEGCPRCGMKRIETKTWICEECLDTAKKEVIKIIDEYLMPDFGLSKKEFEIFFSGHRGYHIHVRSETVKQLSSDGRREIADYIRGIGLDIRIHGFREIGRGMLIGPDMSDGGWRGRLARAIYAFMNKASYEELKKVVSPVVAKTLYENRDKFLKNISSSPPYWGGLKGYTIESLEKIAGAAIKEIACNIDERVTIDSKRLIRCPNSLHGKSALRTMKVSYSSIEGFDPLSKAIPFRYGTIKILVKTVPRIRIGDFEMGPLREETVEVPMSMGLYLMCRGAAKPADSG